MSKNQIIESLNLKEMSEDEIEKANSSHEIVQYEQQDILEGKTREQIDADYVIENQKILIEQSKDVIQHIKEIAVQSETARIFEVFAANIKTQSELNKDLMELHQTRQTISPEPPAEEVVDEEQELTMSTADFQKMVKEAIENK